MNKKQKNKILIPEGHKAPVTRRDFLKYGIIPFAGQVLMPTLLTDILSMSVARADGSRGLASSGYVPFLVFDMAGGSALPGNFLVGKQGGPKDLLATYETLGWNPRAGNALDESFGIPMARSESQILAGMRQAASAAALANLRMGSFCHFSQDDTSSNQTSALTLISRAGLKGRFFDKGVGSVNALSGGNSDVALRETQYKPLFVQNALDIQGSVSHGPAFADFSDNEIKNLSRIISDMSRDQIQKFLGLKGGQQLSEISGKSYEATGAYGKTIQALDARTDQNVAQLYQLNQNGDLKSENQVFASIAYNVIQGNTGPGAITIGECDYHAPRPPEVGQQKDREMGVQIGRAVELAHRLKKPLFFQLLTDGGVASLPGTRIWNSDSNVRSMTIIGFYNPKGAPEQRRLQVGDYTDGETVNQENSLVGGGADVAPSRVADAVLANYLSACGRLGDYEKVGRSIFRNDDLESVLIF